MSAERVYLFYAYHGTAESSGNAIYKTKTFLQGKPRSDHWLGQGIYFFREDEAQAHTWATFKVKNNKEVNGENPCVLEVVIEVKESNFLNLDTRTGFSEFYTWVENLKKEISIKGLLEENCASKIRSYLFSLLPDDIWVIQRTFKVGQSIFDWSELLVSMELYLQGIQVCVRKNSVIIKDKINICLYKRKGRKSPRLL